MKNMRLTVCIGIMCGWLAAGMLHAGTRPDHVRPVEEDGSRLWLPVIRPVEGAEVEITYKGKVSPTIAIAIAAPAVKTFFILKPSLKINCGKSLTSSYHDLPLW